MQLTTVFEPPRPPAWTRFDGGVLVKSLLDASTAAEKRASTPDLVVYNGYSVHSFKDNFGLSLL
jgi:hypothetical protein